MPSMSGIDLCRQIRSLELPRYVYIVFITANRDTDSIVAGFNAGADDFLIKPIVPSELIARIRAGRRVLRLERRLQELADTDPLTGIAVRRVMFDALRKEISRACRYRRPLSCVAVDLDYFKQINDSYGHLAGDVVLMRIGQLLAQSCRTTDLVCRLGGEEFCVMLPETTESQAAGWADRVRAAIEAQSFNFQDEQVTVTASLGVAELTGPSPTVDHLVDCADQALLAAKRQGRNRVERSSAVIAQAQKPKPTANEGDPLTGLCAGDLLLSQVRFLHSHDLLSKAAELMCRLHIDEAPVVDRDGRLAGTLTDQALMAALLVDGAERHKVDEAMRRDVVAYDKNVPAKEIFEYLQASDARRVYVACSGRPIGVISRGSLLAWLKERLPTAAERTLLKADSVLSDELRSVLPELATTVAPVMAPI
jgi:two-component system chemotaxis response regulator CheY